MEPAEGLPLAEARIDPSTFRLRGERSTRLSYAGTNLTRGADSLKPCWLDNAFRIPEDGLRPSAGVAQHGQRRGTEAPIP